jgi:hypothetical protein
MSKEDALKLIKPLSDEQRYDIYSKCQGLDVLKAISLTEAAHGITKGQPPTPPTPPAQEFVCSTGLCHYKPAAPDLQAELDATNRQVEILSDALAESRREVAALTAVQEPDYEAMWHKVWPDVGSFVRASADDLKKFAKAVSTPPAAPVQRQWVGLTKQEIAIQVSYDCTLEDMVRSVEAKLKEKNT